MKYFFMEREGKNNDRRRRTKQKVIQRHYYEYMNHDIWVQNFQLTLKKGGFALEVWVC